MSGEKRLYLEALMEIAEAMGHSWEKPISLSLLCLSHGISFEEKGKIYTAFNKILKEYEFDDLELNLFRKAMEECSDEAKDFADIVVKGFVKAYAIVVLCQEKVQVKNDFFQ